MGASLVTCVRLLTRQCIIITIGSIFYLPDIEIVMTEMLKPDSEFAPADYDQATVLDPALGQFLRFLARDIEENPQNLKVISSDLVSRAQSLVSGVEIDLDALLLNEDD
jgi:hypothetical protein